MGQFQIPIFQAFANQTSKQSGESSISYLCLSISLGMISRTKLEFSAK